jgi:VanZ family protein
MMPIAQPRSSWKGNLLIATWGFVALAYAVAFFLASGTALGRTLERIGGGSSTGWDKVLHASGFFLFGLLAFQFFTVVQVVWRRSPSLLLPVFAAFFLGCVYAVIHEGGQALFPGLVPEASDVVADVLGLGVAIFLFFLWRSTERVVFGAGAEGRRLSWRDLR